MNHRLGTLAALSLILVTATIGVPEPAQGTSVEDTGAFGLAGETVIGELGPIDEVVAPTSAAPSFVLAGEELRVELEPGALEDPLQGTPSSTPIRLEPSFDDGRQAVNLTADVGQQQASSLWEGPYARQVVPLTVQIPSGTDPGLYDVVLPAPASALEDRARRAVSVHDAWPEKPEIVLLADTQTGDPRAMENGFEDSTGVDPLAPHEADPRFPPDPGPFNESVEKTLGIDVLNLEITPGDRWGAYRAAIERINTEIQPDLVLFSGDLTFGQSAPGSYHVEYEESWALLNGATGLDGTDYRGIQAPTLLSPGNHDGYVQTGEDGFAFWEAYFGPPAFATEFHNVTFTSINTYDWSELDRKGFSYAVSAWGGQIREDQLAWLRETLCEANGGTPVDDENAIAGKGCSNPGDERVVTFSHHSPSWVLDPWKDAYDGAYRDCPCQGTPALEQTARGLVSFTSTDQAWSGEGRLELRDTLREFDVDLHAAGHTHRDRIARDVGDGTIVETPQHPRNEFGDPHLYRVTRADEVTPISFEEGRTLIEEGEGPLYVETTTAASGTDQYFGFRPVTWHESTSAFPDGALGIAPFQMGVPMSDAILEEIARRPAHWNASHAELGLYSTPTFYSIPSG